jgi:hypothetical protein
MLDAMLLKITACGLTPYSDVFSGLQQEHPFNMLGGACVITQSKHTLKVDLYFLTEFFLKSVPLFASHASNPSTEIQQDFVSRGGNEFKHLVNISDSLPRAQHVNATA